MGISLEQAGEQARQALANGAYKAVATEVDPLDPSKGYRVDVTPMPADGSAPMPR